MYMRRMADIYENSHLIFIYFFSDREFFCSSQNISINLSTVILISCSAFLLSILLLNEEITFWLLRTVLIILASSFGSFGSNNNPLFLFIYSGIPPTFDPITGVPHAIDSKPTSPSGSSLDGKINIVAMLYNILNSGWSTFF